MGVRKEPGHEMIALPQRTPRKVTETDIVKSTIDRLCRIRGVRALRNSNVVLTDVRGIPVKAGLGNGSPDIVGIISIGGIHSAFDTASPPFSVAFGVEMKTPTAFARKNKGASDDQIAWARAAIDRGMPVFLGCSVEVVECDVLRYVDELRGYFGARL